MRVQHRADARLLGGDHVQQRLGRRLGLPLGRRLAAGADADKIAPRQPALVLAAGGDEQLQRIAADDDAVVAAGADAPAALPEHCPHVAEGVDLGHKAG